MRPSEHAAFTDRTGFIWFSLVFVSAAFLWLLHSRGDASRFGQFHDDTIYLATAQAIATQGRPIEPSLPGTPYQTKYPLLYPYVMSLVWLVRPDFPQNLSIATGASAVLAVLGLVTAFFYLRRWKGVSPVAALSVIVVCCTHETFLLLSSSVLSEPLFVLFALQAFALGDSSSEKHSWFAGVAAGLSMMTRNLGIAVVGGVAIAYALRRDWRQLQRFCLGAMPFAIGTGALRWILSAPTPATGPAGFRQTWLYYSDYVGFWRLSVPDVETLIAVLKVNLVEVLLAPANLALTRAPAGLFPTIVWVTASCGILVGLIRQARQDRLRGPHLALVLHVPIVMLWNYEIAERLLVLFQPFFAVGLWIEGRFALRGFVETFKRRRPLLDRAIAVAALAVGLAFLTYVVGARTATHQTAIAERLPGHQALYGSTYRWIKENTGPTDRFIAIDDALLYLHTGRQAMWPLALTTEPAFRPDPFRFAEQMERIGDVGRQIDADYVIWSEGDYANAPVMQQRWRRWAHSCPLVASHEGGRVKVFRFEPQESTGWQSALRHRLGTKRRKAPSSEAHYVAVPARQAR